MPGVLTSCLPLPASTFALSLCDPHSVTAHPTPSDLLWPAWPQGTGNRGREERVTFLLLPASAFPFFLAALLSGHLSSFSLRLASSLIMCICFFLVPAFTYLAVALYN